MIREFSVTKLSRDLNFDLSFHEDLNILTGKNGSGKTTLLKLLWYMTSGNIERISSELAFETAKVTTDTYSLLLKLGEERRGRRLLQWVFESDGKSSEGRATDNSERLNVINHLVAGSGASLFFPTFRRIEGGFSMTEHRLEFEGGRRTHGPVFSSTIEPSLAHLSDSLSVLAHRFVASVSTSDIVTSLTSHYANVSEQLNEDHWTLSQEISALVRKYDQETLTVSQVEKLASAQAALAAVQEIVGTHSKRQEDLLQSFSALSGLIKTIFQHKGIQVTSRITLGDAQEAIGSDKLSAGEKQMLSFLVYNAFASDAVIFIDEPEISLHVDWQRQLFPTLLQQGTSNQFMIATHSPFIYSQYSDKELVLDADRGE